jgi:hypothetical protein
LNAQKLRQQIDKSHLHKAGTNLKGQMSSPSILPRPKSLGKIIPEQTQNKSKIINHKPEQEIVNSPQRIPSKQTPNNLKSEEENIRGWDPEDRRPQESTQAAVMRQPIKSALKSKPSIPVLEAEPSALAQIQQLRMSELLAQRQKKQEITEKPNKMRYL